MEIELKIRRMHQLDGLSISAFQSCPQHSLEVPRPSRSIHYQVGIAKFPMARDLDRFDTSKSPVNPAHLPVLDRDDFLAHKRNLLLIGGSGTGKTHLVITWGAMLCARKSECSSTLANQLELEKVAGKAG